MLFFELSNSTAAHTVIVPCILPTCRQATAYQTRYCLADMLDVSCHLMSHVFAYLAPCLLRSAVGIATDHGM